jgi:hypothetical protein
MKKIFFFLAISLISTLPISSNVDAKNVNNNTSELLAQQQGAGLWQYYCDCTVYDARYPQYRQVVGTGKLFVRQYNGAIYLQLRLGGQKYEVYSGDDGRYYVGSINSNVYYWLEF